MQSGKMEDKQTINFEELMTINVESECLFPSCFNASSRINLK